VTITAKAAQRSIAADGKPIVTLEWTPKSYACRSVPIPVRTVTACRELRDQSDASPYLFLTIQRLRRINRKATAGTLRPRFEICNNVLRGFSVIQKQAAHLLNDDAWQTGTVHDLRRTFGTHAANRVPMHVLRSLMGHADISTTANFYLAVGDEHADSIRNMFDSH